MEAALLVPFKLIVWRGFVHASGATVISGDYQGHHAMTATNERRFFLALRPDDPSHKWLDVTDRTADFLWLDQKAV